MEALPELVFSDMDGTWLATDKSVPEACARALDALAEVGIGFVPCTGRPAGAIPAELLEHPATRYAASANGAVVWELGQGPGGAKGSRRRDSPGKSIRGPGLTLIPVPTQTDESGGRREGGAGRTGRGS